jgi:hypothetical protein
MLRTHQYGAISSLHVFGFRLSLEKEGGCALKQKSSLQWICPKSLARSGDIVIDMTIKGNLNLYTWRLKAEAQVDSIKLVLEELTKFVRFRLREGRFRTWQRANVTINMVHYHTRLNIPKVQATVDHILRSMQAIEDWQPSHFGTKFSRANIFWPKANFFYHPLCKSIGTLRSIDLIGARLPTKAVGRPVGA